MNFHKHQKNFSLIELLISVSIFVVLMITTTSLYFSSIEKHTMALNLQSVTEDIKYATEAMKKDIKNSYIMALSTDGKTIYLNNKTKNFGSNCEPGNLLDCLQYRFNSTENQIEVKANGDSGFVPLTSSNIIIENFSFYIDNAIANNDSKQPKVTIKFKAKAKNDSKNLSEVSFQTTVSQKEIGNLYQGMQ